MQGSVRRSLFDEGVFNQFGVLTSPGIQRRFIRAVANRDDIPIFQEYWLLDIDDKNDVPKAVCNKVSFKSVNSKKTPVFFEKTPVNAYRNSQSKLKESKRKYTTTSGSSSPDLSTPYRSATPETRSSLGRFLIRRAFPPASSIRPL